MVKHTQTIRQLLDDEFFERVWPKKFYIRRNNIKANSIEAGRIVIAHLLPLSDVEKSEKCMYTTLF